MRCLLPVSRNSSYATPTYKEAALLLRCTIKASAEAFNILERFSIGIPKQTCHTPARCEQAQARCGYLCMADITSVLACSPVTATSLQYRRNRRLTPDSYMHGVEFLSVSMRGSERAQTTRSRCMHLSMPGYSVAVHAVKNLRRLLKIFFSI